MTMVLHSNEWRWFRVSGSFTAEYMFDQCLQFTIWFATRLRWMFLPHMALNRSFWHPIVAELTFDCNVLPFDMLIQSKFGHLIVTKLACNPVCSTRIFRIRIRIKILLPIFLAVRRATAPAHVDLCLTWKKRNSIYILLHNWELYYWSIIENSIEMLSKMENFLEYVFIFFTHSLN